MPLASQFEAASVGLLPNVYLGEVTSVQDPDSAARVQVKLYQFDGFEGQDAQVWARVAVPFAGQKRGAFFIPDVGDEVLVAFVSGDSRYPVVVGSFWNGKSSPPDQISGSSVDRWTIVGKNGSRIAIVEQSSSNATITLKTANGVSVELTDQGGGKAEIKAGSNVFTMDSSGITLKTSSTINVKASTIQVDAPTITVKGAITTVQGLLKCDTLQATTILCQTYTPGVGNIW